MKCEQSEVRISSNLKCLMKKYGRENCRIPVESVKISFNKTCSSLSLSVSVYTSPNHNYGIGCTFITLNIINHYVLETRPVQFQDMISFFYDVLRVQAL